MKWSKTIFFVLLFSLQYSSYSQSVQMIDVGGYKLEVIAKGIGNPTVVFEAGLGIDQNTWTTIIPYVTQFTSVVSYSRAGLGKSEKRNNQLSFDQIVLDLRAVLDSLNIDFPFIFVGHSMGGLIGRQYISKFPNDVSGLLIIDGSHEKQDKKWEAQDPENWKLAVEEADNYFLKQPITTQQEYDMFNQLQNDDNNILKLPDIPIVVITSTSPKDDYNFWTPERKIIWRDLHSEWFTNVQNGMHVVTNRSGHYIHLSEPELVVNAIKYLVNFLRTDDTRKN